MRRYCPQPLLWPGTVYLTHGGYGLFGTLDLQGGYCRILAQGLGCTVVAVEYRLAPEGTLGESVEDFIAVARSATVSEPVVLAGDSAGGAIAVSAAAVLPESSGLLLTNPNLDLSLAAFDSAGRGVFWGVGVFLMLLWLSTLGVG
ncbi:alpha/beta hydrolase [Dermatophilus congolensis]|uniref:alpha/beta hydrolase n=1 Tax=Dermatophilus congolensis TaxID=1863 RepID=UPI0012FD7D31|nr:alpha/beta hydrolase fold domain-containing protein [Dermatophilus congolensis]